MSSPLDLLSEVHHLLGSGRELGDLLEHVAEILVRGYGAQGAQVWRVDGDAASPVATAGAVTHWPASLPAPPDTVLPTSVDERGLVFTAVGGEAGGVLRAVMGVWTEVAPEGERRRVLDLFGEHVALAVMDDETRGRISSLVDQLTVLHRYGRLLQRDPDPVSARRALLKSVTEGLGFPRALLFLRTGGEMRAVDAAGLPHEDVAGLAIPVDEPGAIHEVLRRREPLRLEDPKADPRMRAGYAEVVENPGALILVPLIGRDRTVTGILAVDDAGMQDVVTPELMKALNVFSDQAVQVLQNAQVLEASLRTAGTLSALVEATDAAFIMHGPDRRLLFANERAERIFQIPFSTLIGHDVGDLVRTIGKLRFADPEGFERTFMEELGDEQARIRERLLLADGRAVERLSAPVHDEDGSFLGRVSVYRDVTARERLIEELAGLVEVSGVFAEPREFPELLIRVQAAIARVMRVSKVAVWQHDAEHGGFRLYRPSHGLEIPAGEVTYEEGDPLVETLLSGGAYVSHDVHRDARFQRGRALVADLPVTSSASVPLQAGGRVRGVLAVYDPIDGRRFEDRDLRLLTVLGSQLAPFLQNAELVRSRLDLAEAVRRVNEVSAEIAAEPDVVSIARRAAGSLVEEFGLAFGRVWILEEGTLILTASEGEVTDLGGAEARVPIGEGVVGRVAEVRRPVLTSDLEREPGLDHRWAGEAGYVAYSACPLTVGDEVVGVMAGFAREPVAPEMLDLMASLARHAASAIGKSRAYERERMIARSLQQGLIPEALPNLPGMDVAARYSSATTGAEVGGDLFDAFPMDGSAALFIADVSGKGVAAASTAALVKHALRALATRETEAPRILAYLNRTLMEQGTGQFVTGLLGVFDPERRRFRVAAAGHPPPIRLRTDGRVEELEVRGPALGIVEDASYDAVDVGLDPGETLVLYTDGLIECRSELGDFYGPERLLEAVTRGGESPEAVADALVREVSEFCGGSFGDDVALLVARVR